jgi:hypothetical protein
MGNNISDSVHTTGAVSGTSTSGGVYVGGIVGEIEGDTLTRCYSEGTVSASTGGMDYVGGIAGQNNGGTISNSVALTTSITTTTGNPHRVLGDNNTGTLINNWGLVGMSVNSTPVTGGAVNGEDGGDFSPSSQASWTASGTGPGWTFAASQGVANSANPWWWDTGLSKPRLWWE